MPSLLQIGIDKPFVMPTSTWYFRYKGVQFKFVQTPQKWSDLLLTLTEKHGSAEEAAAYALGAEWASALAWQLKLPVSVRPVGMAGVGAGVRLRRLRGNIFTFPQLPYHGRIRGYDIKTIAHISDDHQRQALALYREARASNSVLLTILLYWQILEIRSGDPVGWINKTMRKSRNRLHRTGQYLRYLSLGSRALGNYLLDDCRHAIAHIKRRPGSTALRLDSLGELGRLNVAAGVLEELAECYIVDKLGLAGRLHLTNSSYGPPQYGSSGTG